MSIFRDDILQGRVALLTGGGSGITFAIAEALVAHGASVALVSRRQERLDEAAEIVLENDETGAQTEAHQKFMMGEVAKLTAGSNGARAT